MTAVSRRHHKSGLIAAALVLATIALLATRQTTKTELPPLDPLPPRVLARYAEWSAPLQAEWEQFSMTPLSDGARIREQLTLLAKEAVGTPGFEITEEKRAALVDAAAVFLEAWSSPTAAEYLRKIAPYRVPLTHPADGQAVLSCYQPLTGRPLPLDLTAEEVLDQFWRGRPDCPARPTMASFGMGEAIIDFTLRNNDRGPREITRWGRLSDDSISEKWIGPISGGGPCVSAPSVGYEEVRREHGPEIESAFIGCIAQCTDGHRCVMQLYWYWSPGSRQWHLRTVGFVTTHETFLWAF